MNTVIFDMDGLLIDSEPFWQAAEKKTFNTVGIELTDDMCLRTMGRRTDEVVAYWYNRYPWQGKDLKTVELEIVHNVKERIEHLGTAMDGVYETLELLKNHRVRMGLASSSPMELIETALQKLEIIDYFQVIHSAVEEEQGKPHPAVYLTAAGRLNARPGDCVVLEDSPAGVQAGKDAGMRVIAIPEPGQYGDERFKMADMKLRSLSEFNIRMIDADFRNGPSHGI